MFLKARHCYMAPATQKLKRDWGGDGWGTSQFLCICRGFLLKPFPSFPDFLHPFPCNERTANNPAAGLKLIPSQSHAVFKCAQRSKVGLEKRKYNYIHTVQLEAFGDRCCLPIPHPTSYSTGLWEVTSHLCVAKWGNTTYCRQVEGIKRLNFGNMKMMCIKI